MADRHRHAGPLRDARLPDCAADRLRWALKRSLWLLAMYAGAAAGAVPTFSPRTAALSSALALALLCLGFSVGFHRGYIHRSYQTYAWCERLLMYLAMLNGFGGLLQMFRKHEIRDYWQNQASAPPYYRYGHGLWRDYLWYLHLDHAGPDPITCIERTNRSADPFLVHLDRHWMLHQCLLAGLFFLLGGLAAVVWGVCVRISVSTTGIWLVNYVAHTHGYRNFEIAGSVEQGRNSLWLGALSMGEGWHNNHHAFPRSACFGVRWWEIDPGFLCIRMLERLGLVWDVRTAADMTPRPHVRSMRPWCGKTRRMAGLTRAVSPSQGERRPTLHTTAKAPGCGPGRGPQRSRHELCEDGSDGQQNAVIRSPSV